MLMIRVNLLRESINMNNDGIFAEFSFSIHYEMFSSSPKLVNKHHIKF